LKRGAVVLGTLRGIFSFAVMLFSISAFFG
jgi:hypothetical protein